MTKQISILFNTETFAGKYRKDILDTMDTIGLFGSKFYQIEKHKAKIVWTDLDNSQEQALKNIAQQAEKTLMQNRTITSIKSYVK